MGILKWVVTVAGVLVALFAAIWGIGLATPREHSARAERVIDMPVTAVAARIRNVREYPSWRRGVTVEVKEEREFRRVYAETSDGDRLEFDLRETIPDHTFVSHIVDSEMLPFGGRWTFTLIPEGERTRVEIHEEGHINSPLYRFFARYVFGYNSTLKSYLDALEASAR